jgi:hypothetical protein
VSRATLTRLCDHTTSSLSIIFAFLLMLNDLGLSYEKTVIATSNRPFHSCNDSFRSIIFRHQVRFIEVNMSDSGRSNFLSVALLTSRYPCRAMKVQGQRIR